MPASAAQSSALPTCTQTALLGLTRIFIVAAEVWIFILESLSLSLLDGLTFSDTEASTSMKQSAPSSVQEWSASVQGCFLNFVEQRTQMVPSLRPRRTAKMYFHERPLSHIWSSFIFSSSVHGILLFFDFNSAWCILKCAAALWLMFIAARLIDKWKCSEIDGSLNSRLYVTSSLIMMHLRKPWKGHFWYSATGITSAAVDGLWEVCEAWWRLLSTKVAGHPSSAWGCSSSISGVTVNSATRGPGCLRWSSEVCLWQVVEVAASATHCFHHFAGCGSSSLVLQVLWLSSVFTKWWVSLLISVYVSWCPHFCVAGLPLSTRSAELKEPWEAHDAWQWSSLIEVAECLRWTSDCAWLKGWGEGAVQDVFR